MAKFKVGDRVRVIDDKGGGKLGDEATVTEVNYDNIGHETYYELSGLSTGAGGLYERRLELVTTPIKVGDAVRFTADNPNGGSEFGAKGTIAIVTGGPVGSVAYGQQVSVKLDGFSWNPDVPVSVLELVQQLTIQVGRYYKTRDGRKVGPMKTFAENFIVIEGDGNIWKSDGKAGDLNNDTVDLVAEWVDEVKLFTIEAGKFYKTRDDRKVGPMRKYAGSHFHVGSAGPLSGELWRIDGSVVLGSTGLDLVAEWVEPVTPTLDAFAPLPALWPTPAKPINDNTPKFKAGDRVLVTHTDFADIIPVGTITTIDRIDDDGDAHLWDANMNDTWFFFAREFKAAPSNHAIVCLIENGQPKPSDFPHVHPTRGHAEDEAARLARKFKGKKFGVYELVSTKEEAAPVYEHEWQRLAANGNVILAIKELRAKTGITLRGAKDAVEDWRRYNVAA